MQHLSTSSRSRAALGAVTSVFFAASALAQRAVVDELDVKTDAPPIVKTEPPMTSDIQVGSPTATSSAPYGELAVRPDHSRVYYQDAADGIWARGATYKARFGDDGIELVPLFGARAPHNMPLALELTSATVAGDALNVASDVKARRVGDTLEFDRGGLIERFSASPDELEQSFVFDSLPLRGELSVRVAFGGEYNARGDGNAIRFDNALGTIECGNAVVVDAKGARLDLPIVVSGASYEIDVPADFVQRATLPLVVDPTFQVFAIDTSILDDVLADSAYDLSTDTWRVVYQETISATDSDIFSAAFTTAGQQVPAANLYVDSTHVRWARPRIANNRISRTFSIVAEVGAVGSREVKTCSVNALTNILGPVSTVAPNTAGEVFNPTIGGDPNTVPLTYFLVVYERDYGPGDHDVHARLLDGAGTPYSSAFSIDNTGATLDEAPAVSKSNGVPPASEQNWTVVWQRRDPAGDHDVYGARVHSNGLLQDATFPIAITAIDETNPSVSSPLDAGGNARSTLVAYESKVNALDHDIKIALLSGAVVSANGNLQTMGMASSEEQLQPHVDTDGREFAVSYSESVQGMSNYDVYVSYVGSAGNWLFLNANRDWIANASAAERNPSIVAAHSSGATTVQYFAAWDKQNGASHDIAGALITGPQGGYQFTFCYVSGVGGITCPCGNAGATGHGCANSANPLGAQLSASGTASVSHDTMTLIATGMPSTASVLFFEGTTQSNNGYGIPFGDGRKCIGGALVRYPLKGAVNGQASYPQAGDASIAAAGFVPAIGATRYYQAWYRDPATFCSNATFNLTPAIGIVWTP